MDSKNGVRENAKGEKLTVEFLEDDQTFERVMTPYIRNLRLIGIDAGCGSLMRRSSSSGSRIST